MSAFKIGHIDKGFAGRLSENVLSPKLFVILKKLSSEYQPYTCGNFSDTSILEKITILGQPPCVGFKKSNYSGG